MANEAASADHLRTTPDVSRQAFLGHTAFLLECSRALELDDRPIFRSEQPDKWVYFIGAEDGPIKIGWAGDPWQRLLILQIGNPQQLYIYAITPGGVDVERELHSEFNRYRLLGEWFERSEPILRRIMLLQQAEITRLSPFSLDRAGVRGE